MEKTNAGFLKLTFADGSKQCFEYVRAEDVSSIASRIQESLKANQVLIEMEDKLLIVPISSLKTIEVSPPPAKLPGYTIRFAQLVQD
jgi:hypothetical protein